MSIIIDSKDKPKYFNPKKALKRAMILTFISLILFLAMYIISLISKLDPSVSLLFLILTDISSIFVFIFCLLGVDIYEDKNY